jgi:hypothetical protein
MATASMPVAVSNGVPAVGVNEVQGLTISGTVTAGTFRLSFQGFVTDSIPWNATTAQVETALNNVASLGAGGTGVVGVVVTGTLDTRATLTTALAGANNDLVYTAKLSGVEGNTISIEYENPGVETPTETVTVTAGTAIKVVLRSVTGVLSTAAQVQTAIQGHAAANALVSIANAAGNNGTGAVIDMNAVNLTGGAGMNVTFSGSQVARKAQGLLLLHANDLVGGGTVVITESTAGVTVFGRGLAPGAQVINGVNGTLYYNSGTAEQPAWTPV